MRGCSCGVGGASRPAFRRARGKQAHEAQASVGQEVVISEIATSRLAPGHSYAVFRSCSTISRVLSITMVRSWHCVRTGGCDGWGAKFPTSTVHQKEQDGMPGWGGRGEHGGLVQVREGNLEGRGAMGGIAGFDISVRRPPTPRPSPYRHRPTTVRQADYSPTAASIYRQKTRTHPPSRRAGFVVCVCVSLSRRVVALVRGAGGRRERGCDLSEIATSRLAPGHSYAVFRSCSTIMQGVIQHDGSKLASCAPMAVTVTARSA